MYIRLKNMNDLMTLQKVFVANQNEELFQHIKEDLSILDSYGIDRSSFALGGYVILSLNPKESATDIDIFCETYHLEKDLSEYEEDVCKDESRNILWRKVLYILGGDENLLIYYPISLC